MTILLTYYLPPTTHQVRAYFGHLKLAAEQGGEIATAAVSSM